MMNEFSSPCYNLSIFILWQENKFFLVIKSNKLQVFILNLVQEGSALLCEHIAS